MFSGVSLASLALIHIVERHFAFSKRFGLGVARNMDVSAVQLDSSRPAVDFCPNGTVRGFQQFQIADLGGQEELFTEKTRFLTMFKALLNDGALEDLPDSLAIVSSCFFHHLQRYLKATGTHLFLLFSNRI